MWIDNLYHIKPDNYHGVGTLKLLLLLPRYVKLSVVVTGCVPMSVDGGVGIPGLKD